MGPWNMTLAAVVLSTLDLDVLTCSESEVDGEIEKYYSVTKWVW
jgi:hypothetical protein